MEQYRKNSELISKIIAELEKAEPTLNYDPFVIPEFAKAIDDNARIAEMWQKQRVLQTKLYISETIPLKRKGDGRKTKKDWVFLTVNPRPEEKWESFISSTHSYFKTAGITECMYTFEQRAEEGEFKGLHMHAIFKRSIKPYRIEKNIHTSFDRFTTTGIKIKYVDEDQVAKIKRYIEGNKKDEKMPKAHYDVLMRKKYNLAPTFTC